MRVFIADGSKTSLRRLLTLVGDIRGFELVGYSADAYGANVSIDAVKPDVVILDLEMRGGSGIDVLKFTKQKYPSMFFIILTNASSEQYRKHCVELGADFFFDKSTEFSQIPVTIEQLAEKLSGGIPQKI